MQSSGMICYFETSAVIHGNSHTEIYDTLSSWTLYTHHPQTNTHTVTNRKKEKKRVSRLSYWIIVTHLKKHRVAFALRGVRCESSEFCLYENNMKNNSLSSLWKHTDLSRCSESGGQECKMCLEGTWQLSMTLRNDANVFYYPRPNSIQLLSL